MEASFRRSSLSLDDDESLRPAGVSPPSLQLISGNRLLIYSPVVQVREGALPDGTFELGSPSGCKSRRRCWIYGRRLQVLSAGPAADAGKDNLLMLLAAVNPRCDQ